MAHVLIIGGYGNAGQAIARLLLQHTDTALTLAGRSSERAAKAAAVMNAAFPGERVAARTLDVADAGSLASALAGADLVLVAASTSALAGPVASAALAAGVDYFDINLSSPAKLGALSNLRGAIEDAGRCFITDGGFHPGVPAAMVRWAALQFDQLVSAPVASLMRIDWRQYQFSEATFPEFVSELATYEPKYFKAGRWQRSWQHSLQVNFGEPFGVCRCAPMRLAEMEALTGRAAGLPDLQETGFYVAGVDWFSDLVVMPLGWLMLKAAPRLAGPATGRMLIWSWRRGSRPPFELRLVLCAAGVSAGISHSLRLEIAHADAYYLTAAPVVAALRQYLQGHRPPGLHLQGVYVEPVAFLDDLERQGVRVQIQRDAEEGSGPV